MINCAIPQRKCTKNNINDMYILTDINNKVAYYSSVLSTFSAKTGICRNTLRNWLKQPENGVKRGYLICEGIELKCNKGYARK